jgi:putative ABC transport system substrate-binding protein
VGVLTDHVPLAAIFVQGLSDAAWDVGQDVIVVRRGAGTDRWRAAARELAALPVSVIVAGDHAAARAAREATDAIPIVAIDFVHDPIASGFVSSLTRPGGNVTGFFCDFDDAMSRLARALRDAVPATRHLVALTDGPSTEAQARALRAARAALGLDIDTLDIAVGSAETLIDRVGASHAALIVPASPRLQAEAVRLAKRAIRRRVASAGAFVHYAHGGGLLARGPSLPDAFRRAAATVDRLLHGARAADVAVERPPRFELVLNARTAAALEVPLPPALVSSADHIVR